MNTVSKCKGLGIGTEVRRGYDDTNHLSIRISRFMILHRANKFSYLADGNGPMRCVSLALCEPNFDGAGASALCDNVNAIVCLASGYRRSFRKAKTLEQLRDIPLKGEPVSAILQIRR